MSMFCIMPVTAISTSTTAWKKKAARGPSTSRLVLGSRSAIRHWSGVYSACSLVSTVVDKDTQEKIEIVKGRLMKDFGYDEISATDVLNYVASIFARGDTKDE